MAKIKVGAVLVFRDGVTLEQASKAMAPLRGLLEECKLAGPPELRDRYAVVKEFDSQYGEPVWYIP